MAAPIVLVRLLTQDAYGVYTQFNLVASTFLPILGLGLGSSLFYFYPRLSRGGQMTLMGQTYLMLCSISILFLLVYFLFGLKIHRLLGVENLDQFKLLVPVYVLFMLVSNLSNFVFTVQVKIKYNLFFFPFDVFLRSILLIFFVAYFKQETMWVFALLFYSVIRFVFMSNYLYKEVFHAIKRFNKGLLRKQLNYSLPFAGAIIISVISTKIDKLIINNFISTAEFAIYSVAFLSVPLLNELVQSTQSVLVPKLSEYFQDGQTKMAAFLWRKAVTNIASIAIPVIVFFGTVADDLYVLLYTEKYSMASTLFRIILISYVLRILIRGVVFRASNNTDKIFYIDSITLPIIGIVGFLLIKHFGLFGGVVAALLGQSLPTIFKLYFEKKIMQVNLKNWLEWQSIGKILLSSILPAIIIYFTILINIKSLFLSLFIGAIVFFSLTFLLEYYLDVFMYKKEFVEYKKVVKEYLGLGV